MAAGNQGQGRRNEGNERNSGGAGQPSRESGQNPQQGVQQVTDRFREGYDQAREELAHRYRRAEGAIARNPGNSVLIGFGLGFGIGLAITALLTQREETWAERYLPESLQDLPDRVRKSRLPERVRDAKVPESVHHTLHHLTDAIRELPASVAKLVGR
jgi:hypothetical protein